MIFMAAHNTYDSILRSGMDNKWLANMSNPTISVNEYLYFFKYLIGIYYPHEDSNNLSCKHFTSTLLHIKVLNLKWLSGLTESMLMRARERETGCP